MGIQCDTCYASVFYDNYYVDHRLPGRVYCGTTCADEALSHQRRLEALHPRTTPNSMGQVAQALCLLADLGQEQVRMTLDQLRGYETGWTPAEHEAATQLVDALTHLRRIAGEYTHA